MGLLLPTYGIAACYGTFHGIAHGVVMACAGVCHDIAMAVPWGLDGTAREAPWQVAVSAMAGRSAMALP